MDKLITDGMLTTARGIISRCEVDLGRTLGDGEKRDLLMDNTKWRSDTVRAIVAELQARTMRSIAWAAQRQ